jgi:hypothetical protein
MLTRFSEALKKYTNGWLILFFLAGELLFNVVILPAQQARLEAASGGVGPIDLMLFYTPEQVYSMVEAYGTAGRAAYRTFELTGDILYPIVYTLFFSLLLTWLFQRGFAPDSPVQRWNVLPLATWLFDLLENLGIVAMLSVYPSTPGWLAWTATLFTLLKWLSVAAIGLLLLLSLVMAIKNRFKRQAAADLAGA